MPKDRLLPYMDAFARVLVREWRARTPDVVHSHYWMSGLACSARPGRWACRCCTRTTRWAR